ncbi:MAG: hypothetical protein Q9212_002326 [Teloschistes hypoglaucus]
MPEGGVEGEADESDKENAAARSYTHHRDPPTIRQNITSAGTISPIRVPRDDDDEMIHRHTSLDPMGIHRGVEDLRMPNRSILRRRRRDPTPIDITGDDGYENLLNHWHSHSVQSRHDLILDDLRQSWSKRRREENPKLVTEYRLDLVSSVNSREEILDKAKSDAILTTHLRFSLPTFLKQIEAIVGVLISAISDEAPVDLEVVRDHDIAKSLRTSLL